MRLKVMMDLVSDDHDDEGGDYSLAPVVLFGPSGHRCSTKDSILTQLTNLEPRRFEAR